MFINWHARYYDGTGNEVLHTENFYDRTEDEAESEAIGLMPDGCEDWSLIPLIKKDSLKLSIDDESVNVYVDNGDDKDPVHIVYWHLDEVIEDETVAIAMCKAIDLFHTNPIELIKISTLGDVELV